METPINIHKYLSNYKTYESDYNVNALGSAAFKAGKWKIPDNEYLNFLKEFAKIANNNQESYLLEKPHQEYNQVKVDVDFRFNSTNEEQISDKPNRKYNIKFINEFIEEFNDILQSIVKSPNSYHIYVQEKKNPKFTKEKTIKDGIHVMIPDIVMPNYMLFHLRDKLIESVKIQKLFKKINNISDISDVIDKSIIETNSWFLLFSGKPVDKKDYYKITHVYKYSKNIKKLSDDYVKKIDKNKEKYIILLSNHNKKINVEYDELIDTGEIQDFYENNNKTSLSNYDMNKIISNHNLNYLRRTSNLAKEEISSYLSCLSNERFEDYNDWRRVGLSLYNMDDRNYQIWLEWSSKSAKFDEQECFKIWYNEFHKYGKYKMGLHTLKRMAQEDNIDRYKKIINFNKQQFLNAWILKHITEDYVKGIDLGTFSNYVKEYITDYAPFNVVCADPTGSSLWYKFTNHRWKEDKASNIIYMLLAEDLKHEFKKLWQKSKNSEYDSTLNDMANQTANMSMTNDERIDNSKRIEILQSTINRTRDKQSMEMCKHILGFLSVVVNKKKVIEDLSHKCYDEEFFSNLNENKMVFICNNGVLDLENCVFRNGEMSDMCTFSSKIDYPLDVDTEQAQEHIQNIQEYLDKIFVDEEIQDYVLNKLAVKLSGELHGEEFIICTGSGANGKSQLFKLINKTFGEYYGTFNNSLLNTAKEGANSASPAVAGLKGLRLAVTSEPKNNKPMEPDKLKEFIGGDELVGRFLNQNNIKFNPQYKMFMHCNDIPDMPSTDDGVWRKIRVIPFESKFVIDEKDKHKLTKPNKYPKHFAAVNQEHLYDTWAPLLLYLLFERYKILKERNFKIEIPDKVLVATTNYQQESNIYAQFYNDKVEEKPGFGISLSDAYTEFRNFLRDVSSDYNCTKKGFKTQMQRYIGTPKNRNSIYKNITINGVGEPIGDD